MDLDKKLEIIKRNTSEIISEEELKDLLSKKKKPCVYLGTMPTGKPHIGYFVWVLKLCDFMNAGFKVKLLLADLHAVLDGVHWEIVDKRYEYYEKVIPLMFEAIGADVKNLEIVKGSEFQLKPEYTYDVLKMSTLVSIHDAKKAASEVVKLGDNPRLSGVLYPIMQAIDEEYLGADVQLGGLDQRKIFVLARENLPKIFYNPRVEVMTPIIPGIIGKKMSSSSEKGKIDLMDDEETVISKIKGAEMVAGNPDNGIMAFLKHFIMIVKSDKKEDFIVKRDKKFGGDLIYDSYEAIEKDFIEKKLHPLDLKNSVAFEINNLLSIFRKNKKAIDKISREAYG